jgi:hypothetical protein
VLAQLLETLSAFSQHKAAVGLDDLDAIKVSGYYSYSLYVGVQSARARPEGGPTANPEIYGWQSVYAKAILETDDLLIAGRIYEAIAAIEQRRQGPVESNSDEDCALNNAEIGIKALITERTDRFVCNAAPGHWTIRL